MNSLKVTNLYPHTNLAKMRLPKTLAIFDQNPIQPTVPCKYGKEIHGQVFTV